MGCAAASVLAGVTASPRPGPGWWWPAAGAPAGRSDQEATRIPSCDVPRATLFIAEIVASILALPPALPGLACSGLPTVAG